MFIQRANLLEPGCGSLIFFQTFSAATRKKGHSQLAHMRITYHFIANLHVTETR